MSAISERIPAQVPSAVVLGDVHIGQSPISPIPMGIAIAIRRITRTNASNVFIDVRLLRPALIDSRSTPSTKILSLEEMPSDRRARTFRALWGTFVVQVAGRLLDFWWHATHDEFETGRDQVTAHWLVWLGTLLVLGVALRALRGDSSSGERRGYQVVLWSNAIYVVVAIIHFIQHLNHQEVDWAHLMLAITNIGSVVGVLMVTTARRRRTTPATS